MNNNIITGNNNNTYLLLHNNYHDYVSAYVLMINFLKINIY